MRLGDRLLTIAVTATLTSAAWILAGSIWFSRTAPAGTPARSVAAPPVPTPAQPARRAPAAAAGQLMIPVAGVTADQLTDTFSDARAGHSHEAIDIMASRGTPVLAAAAGTIEKLFHSDAGGTTIYERSPDRRTIYYYAHLDAYAPGLREGLAVTQGQVLGAVGSTGDADPGAPHLHFEIMKTTPDAPWYRHATSIDPYPLLGGKPR